VSGKVLDLDGIPLRDTLAVQLHREDNPRISVPEDRSWRLESHVAADGQFRIEHVQAGTYVAKLVNMGPSSLALGTARVVVKENIGDLQIPVQPLGTLTWSIVLEDGSQAEAWSVTLQGWNEGPVTRNVQVSKPAASRLAKPPIFSMKDVPAGAYRVSIGRWAVTKVQIGGQTYEGSKFEFADRAAVATVTVSKTGAKIEGTLEGTRKPEEVVTGTASAALLSGFTDHLPLYWTAPLSDSGEFAFSMLEPGTYAVCAWIDPPGRVTALLRTANLPLETVQQQCKTVTLKANGSESVRVTQTSIEKVMR
jgi:hypothetical protein